MMNFLKHLQQIQHQNLYCESNMLDLLLKCLRKFAFAWFKNQIFIIIQNFDKDLACAFSIISFEFASKTSNQSSATSDSHISHFSSQYHLCVECFAQFSSMTRLLEHTKQVSCSKMICKHCEQNFNFKNKLHEHIREHHVSKSIASFISFITFENSNLRVSTSEFTYKLKKKSTITCSSVSFASSILSATSRNQIFSAKIASRSVSSKCSNLFIATLNITSKSMKKLSINSFTFSTSSFRTSVSKHQKFYFIIDDLIRMFREKSKSFDLSQHQKRRSSSRSFDIFYQSRIIVYFLFAVNQKTSINQNLKNSNSKNFKQHTFAKSISLCRFALSEKSIFSSYKKSDIFYISLQSRFSSKFSFLQSRFSFAWSTSSFTFSSFFRFSISDRVCCICFDHFSFRNDSYNYRRSSQSYLSNRWSMREMKEMISRFEAKLKKNEK